MEHETFIECKKEDLDFLASSLSLCTQCLQELGKLCRTEVTPTMSGADSTCKLCGGARSNYRRVLERLLEALVALGDDWETFRVDIVVEQPRSLDEKQKILFESLKSGFKREFKKEVGSFVEGSGKKFDPVNPHLIITYSKGHFSLKRENIYIEGRYLKLLRNISQAKWICNNCWGSGCVECNFRGRHFISSVEEFVVMPIQALFDAEKVVFHAGGREDVDVCVVGGGRPFVLEIVNPRRKAWDLEEVRDRVNSYSKGIVEVTLMGFCLPSRVQELKKTAETSTKKYGGVIRFYEPVNIDKIKELSDKLSGIIIEQKTPWRVRSRRANRVRYKRVDSFNMEPIDDHSARFTMVCQGGTYVKEFISGDDSRTKPSVSQILGTRCKCVALDLIGVGDEK